jgi:hypothetical protein
VIATGLASTAAGFSAQALGYFNHFCLATALSLGALLIVRIAFPQERATLEARKDQKEAALCA